MTSYSPIFLVARFWNHPTERKFRYGDHTFNHSVLLRSSWFGKLRAPSLALDWQINRLIEVEARVSYHAGRWYEHVASAFPLAHQLSGGAGLGSFSSIAVKYSGYDG
jgi:hypothetical protein